MNFQILKNKYSKGKRQITFRIQIIRREVKNYYLHDTK